MRKWLWGAIPLMVCAAAGAWLYLQHVGEETVPRRAIKVTGGIAVAPRPVVPSPTGPELPPALPVRPPAVEPVPDSAGIEAIEPIVIENREEAERIVQPLRTGQIFVVGAHEVSEPVIGGGQDAVPDYMPFAEEETAEPPTADCCSGFWAWFCCAQPTECPCAYGWVMELVKKLASVVWSPAPAPAVDVPAVNDGEVQEPPLNREDNLGLPSMREDPNYHHHYPSCPYTGGCPYPYHQYRLPTQPIERPVTPPAPSAPPAPPTDQKPGKSSFRSLDTDVAPTIDTMECRPSDLPRLPSRTRPF